MNPGGPTLNRSFAACAVAAMTALPAFANPLETVDVLCGGMSADEADRLGKEVRAATVSLEFYSGTRGNYVSDVDVLFTPVKAPLEAFGIVTSGPRCLVELPPGEYVVNTWFNGNARETRATIPANRNGLVRVTLGFPEEAGKDAFLVPVKESKP